MFSGRNPGGVSELPVVVGECIVWPLSTKLERVYSCGEGIWKSQQGNMYESFHSWDVANQACANDLRLGSPLTEGYALGPLIATCAL